MRRRLTTVMIKNYEFKKLFNEEPSDDEAEIKNKKRKMEIGINKTQIQAELAQKEKDKQYKKEIDILM